MAKKSAPEDKHERLRYIGEWMALYDKVLEAAPEVECPVQRKRKRLIKFPIKGYFHGPESSPIFLEFGSDHLNLWYTLVKNAAHLEAPKASVWLSVDSIVREGRFTDRNKLTHILGGLMVLGLISRVRRGYESTTATYLNRNPRPYMPEAAKHFNSISSRSSSAPVGVRHRRITEACDVIMYMANERRASTPLTDPSDIYPSIAWCYDFIVESWGERDAEKDFGSIINDIFLFELGGCALPALTAELYACADLNEGLRKIFPRMLDAWDRSKAYQNKRRELRAKHS
jgi:hypothetical protein